MSSKKSVYIVAALLLLSIGVCGIAQSSALNTTSQAPPNVSPIQRQFDPPSTYTKLIREYLLPVVPTTVTAFFGPRRGPYGIVYDSTGYTWVTDFNRDAIYRLTPATLLNQTATTASEWPLPNIQGKRSPAYIIVDETRKAVWFTDPTSWQISRLNWSSNVLEDWNLANIAGGIMPLDLVMESHDEIWFTGLNDTRFFKLDILAGLPDIVTVYGMGMVAPFGRPTKIATNGTSLFMTDWKFDRIYEVLIANPANVLVYQLITGGFSWDLDVDPTDNVWVTQPLSSLINEQRANSQAKQNVDTYDSSYPINPVLTAVEKKALDIPIEMTPVTPSEFSGPLNVTGDPIFVWSVPTGVSAVGYLPPPARPWEIAASSNSHGWFTEPVHNHVGVIHPDTNKTLLYTVPTAASWTVCIDNQAANPDHIWFTEYVSGKIGELFNATFTDIRVCPSLPAQYPPPNPGSIRWTPGVEIWIDAPSNGYDAAHHDSGERAALNHLYARVKNMGPGTVTSISVKFYWYHNVSVNIHSNYIPLPPPTPSAQRWTQIGTATIGSLAGGSTTDVYVDWNIPTNMPTYVTIGVQVSAAGDINLYDNVGYCNFTLTSPTAPPMFTIAGIGVGFATGFVLMAAIALVLRKR